MVVCMTKVGMVVACVLTTNHCLYKNGWNGCCMNKVGTVVADVLTMKPAYTKKLDDELELLLHE